MRGGIATASIGSGRGVRAAAAPADLFLQVHVTGHCNLACRHCYLSEPAREMSVGLFGRILDQFDELSRSLGVRRRWVQVTGGEPLLHPHIWEMLELAAARCEVRLLTNGVLIDRAAAARLSETCAAVQVSLDGRPPVHDEWRGPGAFAVALAGLRHLGEAGVWRSVRMTVGQDNIAEVLPLVDLLEGECELFSLARVVPLGGCAVVLPHRVAYRQVIYDLYGRRGGSPAIRFGDPSFGPLIATDDPTTCYRGCSAGAGGLCVVEDGTVLPCRRLPVPVGSVARGTLAEIYHTAPLLRDLRRRELGEPCGTCEDRDVCGGNRCLAYQATGDPLAGDRACIHMPFEEG